MAAKKQKKKATPARKSPARKKAAARLRKPGTAHGPAASEMPLEPAGAGADAEALATRVRAVGGQVLARYRDPYGGHPVMLCALPLNRIKETPFQRDLSKTHAQRLVQAIGAAGIFLDPVIGIAGEDGFHSPNGRHRLAAAKALGMQAITALVVPDARLAYRILALNTEKAHNLRDRALEVIRMARALAVEKPRGTEAAEVDAFESPHLLTLGAAYQKAGRFAGSAWQPMLKRVDHWVPGRLDAALRQRDQYAERLLALDAKVSQHVQALTARGMKSPYLKTLVVARCNPVRFAPPRKQGAPPKMNLVTALAKMDVALRNFDPSKVRPQDLALVAAVASDEG